NAARMLPVAPALIRSLMPSHSIPFVKTSAPTRMSTNAPTMSARSTGLIRAQERLIRLPRSSPLRGAGPRPCARALSERVGRGRADSRDHDDERRDDRVGHAHDEREERNGEQADDERHEMAEVDARDETPDEVLVLDEEHRSRLKAPDEEAGHDHGRGRRAGDPERDHRYERGDAS